ncbi:hypothetical protein TIFTF001_024661 [Ficus carica]|uniref:Tr-type G domain-containing protein n=1 Tax=Ficus carica TaxID=3494 RepID=A0AA88AW04_FICCA|nr:hypothetical protein TIFTF001_024661 [Ficus carica]
MGLKKGSDAHGYNENPGGKWMDGLVIDDDRYSIRTVLSEEPRVEEEKVILIGKKKGKKGKASLPKEEDVDKVLEEDEDNDPKVVFGGKKKGMSNKVGGNNMFSASSFGLLGDEDNGGGGGGDGGYEEEEEEEEEEDALVLRFRGKKKPLKSTKKSGSSLFTALAFDDGNVCDNDGEVVGDLVEESKEVEDDDEVLALDFTGKKKYLLQGGKKGGSVFSATSFDTLNDGDENEDVKKDEENNDIAPITFTGNKKKSSKGSKKSGGSSLHVVLLDEGIDEDTSVPKTSRVGNDTLEDDDTYAISFPGKNKSSEKKSNVVLVEFSEDFGDGSEVTFVVEPEQANKVNKSEDVVEFPKSTKKKKKKESGRTAQEVKDLDNIVAELGEGPLVSLPAPPSCAQEGKAHVQPETAGPVDGEKEGEDKSVESAAAKKKKKKKEKEKEKKAVMAAAAAATTSVDAKDEKNGIKTEAAEPKKNEAKGKIADKKVPKHVREMQEALAKRKEAEERAKREEEERLRREEEERLKKEEEEKKAEEAKHRKKEREREKLQKKRQEGKLLSAKQKAEARRLEAIRNQILSNAGGLPLSTSNASAPTKRPLYQEKKSKPAYYQANGAAPAKVIENAEERESREILTKEHSMEPEYVEYSESVEEKSEVAKENGMEDEDEWDAKSWDDINLSVSAFADEEVDSESKPIVKKELKMPVSDSHKADRSADTKPAVDAKKPVPVEPIRENKRKHAEVEVVGKYTKKDGKFKNKAQNSDATPKSEENLRSPICCIMGHVDTGKTKLLDCIRGTNVQEGEAGGITQQIGATYIPAENIRERTKELKADAKLKVPGLLVIDTPGHESFANLRSRGSGLCDIAILVVDIMHGLEPQTIESLNLLKMRNTDFIIALNKVDRLYGWKSCSNAPIQRQLDQQSRDVQNEFNMRLNQIITQFKEQGLNTELYYRVKPKDMGETYFIVPTSAITGEGIPDLLLLLVNWTQKTMVEKLTFSNEVECTVLEVKVVEGHGTTIDVVLVNGVLREGDQIVVCGMQVPIVTTIRALLKPHPMKELRVKGTYLHQKEIKAAHGIKIAAQGLEHAIAGTGLYVVGPKDDLEDIKEAAMGDMNGKIKSKGDSHVLDITLVGTPICIPQREFIDIGRIASIENNHTPVDIAKKGQKVAIKIVGSNPEEQQKMFGRHFELEDELVSHISRRSIDLLKANYRDDPSMKEWKLVVKLKNLFKIQ